MELESILLPGIDPKRPLVISGPCSAETEEQVMSTAKELKKAGIKIFRSYMRASVNSAPPASRLSRIAFMIRMRIRSSTISTGSE